MFLAGAYILTVHDLAGQTTRSQGARRQRRRPQDAQAACPPEPSSQHATSAQEGGGDRRGHFASCYSFHQLLAT